MMGRPVWGVLLALALSGPAHGVEEGAGTAPSPYPPIQPLIDATAAGGMLTLPPGTYAGPAVLSQPITVDGQGKAIIDNGGEGSVITITGDGATIKNLTLRNSGHMLDRIDAGVDVRGRSNVIKNNVIEDCLFGVNLQQASSNVVRQNTITSKNIEQGMRGDAIRLWYSTDNQIIGNHVEDSRDNVFWYSKENVIRDNVVVRGRYGMHFMYSHYNLMENNKYYDNTVGVFLMYSDSIVMRGNHIERSHGASGIGIGFKETSGVTISDNEVLGNATGLYMDVSPYDTEMTNTFEHNKIAYNGVGILFHTDWSGNVFRANDFVSNFTEVAVFGGGGATKHEWVGNHWDAYEGFDRDHDGVGDTPFQYFRYADRLWMDVPDAQFFRGSVVLELLDFMERLLPFTEPKLLLSDARPALRPNTDERAAPAAGNKR
ncbi:MAG: nitrous oxide reductase family maturation protein NosD [Bacteroidota bacterium]